MFRILTGAMVVLCASALLALSQPNAEGCAAVRRLDGPSISIAEESAIVIWDPVKKVQHFIRRAAFDTKSPDFGFLVPTPTPPKVPLAEVEDGIFQAMNGWMLPKTVEKTRWRPDPFLGMFCCILGTSAKMDFAAKDGVRVLHEQKVGGFETAVLQADNTEDLSNWLKKNGYSNDPELQSWLVPYVGARWTITAFKILQDPQSGQLATTKAVRMSFATERPFFPYREPEKKDAVKPEPKKKPAPTEIDGIWRVESAEGKRKNIAELVGTTIWFGDGIIAGRYWKDDVPFTPAADKEPKWLDILKQPGIYKLEDDKLTWCLAEATGSKARPSGFDAKEGMLLVMRRGTQAEADEFAAQVASRRQQERLHSGSRLLRVLFISDRRMDAKLGASAWHAKIPWSDELTEEQRSRLIKETGVPADQVPTKAWLTTFDDRASPRPGSEEVYFDPSPEQTPIAPPPIIKYNDVWVPIDCALFVVVIVSMVAIAVLRRWRRRVIAAA